MRTTHRSRLRRRAGRLPALAACGVLVLGTVGIWFAPPALATGGIQNSGIQELDGSIDSPGNTAAYAQPTGHDQTAPTGAPWDWSNLFTADAQGVITSTGAACKPGSCPGLINDVGQPYTGDLFTQGSKDVNDVSTWTCTKQSTPPKDQLVNTYASAWTAPAGAGVPQGDTVAFMGLERPNIKGNSNAGFWLFKKSVLCDPTSGTFSSGHSNGDVFLVGSFLGGGTSAVLNQYDWNCTPVSTTDPGCKDTGSLALNQSGALNCPAIQGATPFCQVVNQQVSNGTTTNWNVTTPWSNIVTGGSGPGVIPGPGFLEIGIDLSQALSTPGAAAPCFASFLADTRSSGSSTQAETKNFINGSFPTCGNLKVNKYIDSGLDPNGSSGEIAAKAPDASDVTTGPAVAGWNVAVTSGTNNLCTGTTGTTGSLACSTGSGLTNIPSGTSLSVTETVPAAPVTTTAPAPVSTAPQPAFGYFNTDPGVVPTAGSVSGLVGTTVTKTTTMGASDQTVYVGNECFVNVGFEVDGVPNTAPTATKSLTVTYSITAGNYNDSSATGTVDLKPSSTGSTTWTGLVQNKFVQNDTFNWGWRSTDFSGTVSGPQTGATGATLTSDGYPTCSASTAANFSSPVLGGIKYKDANHDGLRDQYANPITLGPGSLEPLAAGFTMNLYANGTCTGTPVATATSASTVDGNGVNYDFGTQAPGNYSVNETVKSGWRQTGPLDNAGVVTTCVTVTAALGDAVDPAPAIGNTPLSDIGASFTDVTGSTNSKISCTTTDGGGDALPNASTSGSYSGSSVEDGTYTCTIIVADP